MSQQDKDALNQERRDKYETVASRNNAEDKINHAHFLLQQENPPKPNDLQYFQQSPEMAVCLLYLNSGVYRFEEIDNLPTKNEIGLVVNEDQPPSTDNLSWIQCDSWSENKTHAVKESVSKLIHDIRNERLTLDEKKEVITKYKNPETGKVQFMPVLLVESACLVHLRLSTINILYHSFIRHLLSSQKRI